MLHSILKELLGYFEIKVFECFVKESTSHEADSEAI
jgi:hypothetical protein